MKKSFKLLNLALSAGLIFAGCSNQINNSNQATSTDQAKDLESNNSQVEKENSVDEISNDKEVVKIAYAGDLCLGAPNIADINGYFEESGIEVEFVNSKAPKDALGTGKIDVFTGEFAGMVVPATKGLDIVFSTASHTGCKSLYVLKESEIQKTSELVGKSVAVTNGIGNSGHNTALRFFNHDGIDPNEVTFKPVDSAAVIQALEKNEVDSVVLDDQFAKQFVNQGKIRPIRSMTTDEDFGKEVCCVTAFNREFVENNPETAEKIADAIDKANNFIAENTKEATDLLYENNLASGNYEDGLELMKSYNYSVTNDDAKESLRQIFDDYKKIGLIDTEDSTDELMDKFWLPLGKEASIQAASK